ncbi:MAG: 50S ribosome-binding GTPase [Chloroflexota bacterium]|nr:50S ribosome-binding GTPase [Chloroflexota bacterium]
MTAPVDVAERALRLSALAERRWQLPTDEPPARDRARQLREHLSSYVMPRVASLDAPLLVALLGPTGAGKSSLMNAIAGAAVSPPGVLRPTTREAVVVATAEDAATLAEGPLRAIPAGSLAYVTQGARPGVVVVDSPDIDSIERSNRALADTLVEAADLCVFVTTASRYADQVPWDVLGRARQRGLPLVIVVNRLPADPADRTDVLTDLGRLVRDAGLTGTEAEVEIVPVAEGELDDAGQAIARSAAAPVLARIDALAADRDERLSLARRALAGALAGLTPLASSVADDTEAQAQRVTSLVDLARDAYAGALADLRRDLRDGRFLREEVLRQWHSFVNADQVTRFFSSGIGRIRGAVLAAIRGTPVAPVGIVEREATSDVIVLALAHAAEGARLAAEQWSARPAGAALLAADPALWSASATFDAELRPRLLEWVGGIAEDVRARGATKRTLAFGASIGVNVVGVAVMLGVFAHTAGITGTEVGIAAATGFLNQKLLQALFGEAAMTQMIDQARGRLDALLEDAFIAERARFEALVPAPHELRALAAELREAAAELAA